MYKTLLVEDEVVIREGLRELIRQSTYQFRVCGEASNGKEALAFLRTEVPDLLITDIRMREMDGLTMVRKAKEMYPELPIIIISGYGEFEYAQKAIEFGVSSYLLKPIERHEFVAAMRKVQWAMDQKRGVLAPEPANAEDGDRQTGGDARKLIRDVKQIVVRQVDGDLRLQTVAEQVNLSPAYLSQLFKTETGMNYSEYVAEARMERAKWLLVHTRLKIYDVARLSGHQSPKHFMLAFKQQVGVTAGDYRDRHGRSADEAMPE
ncbi:response regulator [Cohnella sp. REN36]|uniref:response regulator transcription factor n=1 Tax=Cohnella sp. REN36 TaxID=2887347 RepID=UPI001D148AF6|nr:response regulator [Cohnella sp. REN36]MCC3371835.1 response regulator [Cohnella sp. REN36]